MTVRLFKPLFLKYSTNLTVFQIRKQLSNSVIRNMIEPSVFDPYNRDIVITVKVYEVGTKKFNNFCLFKPWIRYNHDQFNRIWLQNHYTKGCLTFLITGHIWKLIFIPSNNTIRIFPVFLNITLCHFRCFYLVFDDNWEKIWKMIKGLRAAVWACLLTMSQFLQHFTRTVFVRKQIEQLFPSCNFLRQNLVQKMCP